MDNKEIIRDQATMNNAEEKIQSNAVDILEEVVCSKQDTAMASTAKKTERAYKKRNGFVYGCYRFFKRAFDIFSSLLAIIILSPVLLIVAIAVGVSSKGPIIFKDQREGKNGKLFKVYKFRSMYRDAESRLESYLTEEQRERWEKERKIDNDPRITKVGKFIRRTSLDELPQLFNILFGSMSVVGPRPITKKEYENFTAEEKEIIQSVRPGLTGYWQVCGRSDVDFESGKRQEMELEYFTKLGFWYDIGLIFRTIPAVLKKKGAQ